MFDSLDFSQPIVQWVIIPLLIILARMMDVSLGTFRIILLSKGNRVLASALGFIEIFIWIVAVSEIIQNVSNIIGYLAYALGFALGTYLGMLLESKIQLGRVILRVVVNRDPTELINELVDLDYRVTRIRGEGRFGDVSILFLVMNRKKLPKALQLINQKHPKSFYTIEDVRSASGTLFEKVYAKRSTRATALAKMYTGRK